MDREELEDLYDDEYEAREAAVAAQQKADADRVNAAIAEKEKARRDKAAELAQAAWQEKLPPNGEGGGRIIRPEYSAPQRPGSNIVININFAPRRRPTPEERLANHARLYSLADSVEDPLVRFHNHLHRIFTPGAAMIARVPVIWSTEGRGWQLVERMRTMTLEGQQFAVGGRMIAIAGSLGRDLLRRLGVVQPSDSDASSR